MDVRTMGSGSMSINTWLTLGRVSNLPSVWTNVVAAALVANSALSTDGFSSVFSVPTNASAPSPAELVLMWAGTLAALSLMYLGGMFLNDAFDADWDRKHKIQRPIAQDRVSSFQVWLHGSSMLCLGLLLAGSLYQSQTHNQSIIGWLSACGLAAFILSYNYLHKRFALAPLLMGMCRFGVYFIAALLLAQITMELLILAIGLCAYICGVTYSAKNEHINQVTGAWSLVLLFSPVLLSASLGYSHPFFWLYALAFSAFLLNKIRRHLLTPQRNVGAFIGGLLAGIPLLDGLALASMNLVVPSLLCFAVFLLMPRLQQWISAT